MSTRKLRAALSALALSGFLAAPVLATTHPHKPAHHPTKQRPPNHPTKQRPPNHPTKQRPPNHPTKQGANGQ
jgi:hypothetical protein